MSFIQASFAGVRDVNGERALVELLGASLVAAFDADDQCMRRARRLLHVRGRVLERSISYKEGDHTGGKGIFPSNSFSVAGRAHRSYPYEWLLTGKQWPDDVDPVAREKYLEPPKFIALFGMTWKEFTSLPAWRQVMLKREALLF